VSRPRRPVEPLLEKLIEGKVPKEIAYELGCGLRCVDYHLNRWVRESGCRTLVQAVAKHLKR
jgi:hypothetical protein